MNTHDHTTNCAGNKALALEWTREQLNLSLKLANLEAKYRKYLYHFNPVHNPGSKNDMQSGKFIQLDTPS